VVSPVKHKKDMQAKNILFKAFCQFNFFPSWYFGSRFNISNSSFTASAYERQKQQKSAT